MMIMALLMGMLFGSYGRMIPVRPGDGGGLPGSGAPYGNHVVIVPPTRPSRIAPVN